MLLSSYRFPSNASERSCPGRVKRPGAFSNPRAPTPIRVTTHTSWSLVLGLRKGEVLGLAWECVHLRQGTLVRDHQHQRVRRSLLYREKKTEASDAWLPM